MSTPSQPWLRAQTQVDPIKCFLSPHSCEQDNSSCLCDPKGTNPGESSHWGWQSWEVKRVWVLDAVSVLLVTGFLQEPTLCLHCWFIHALILQVLIKLLLCARQCFAGWGYSCKSKQTKIPTSWSFYSCGGRDEWQTTQKIYNKQENNMLESYKCYGKK